MADEEPTQAQLWAHENLLEKTYDLLKYWLPLRLYILEALTPHHHTAMHDHLVELERAYKNVVKAVDPGKEGCVLPVRYTRERVD